MGLNIKRESVNSGVAVWITVLETALGGFTLDKTGHTDGALLPAGSAVSYNEATRLAVVARTAIVNADAVSGVTTLQVKKGSSLNVGSVVAGTTVTAINTGNTAYDVLTLAAGTNAAFLAGASVGTEGFTGVKGLTYEDTIVGDNVSLSVVIRGTVYARRTPSNTAALATALPQINFSQAR